MTSTGDPLTTHSHSISSSLSSCDDLIDHESPHLSSDVTLHNDSCRSHVTTEEKISTIHSYIKLKKKKNAGVEDCDNFKNNDNDSDDDDDGDEDEGRDDSGDIDEHEVVSRRQRQLYDMLEEIHDAQHKHSDIYRSLLQIDAKIQYYVHGHLVALQTGADRRSMNTMCERRNGYLGPNYLVEHEEVCIVLHAAVLINLHGPQSNNTPVSHYAVI